MTYNRIDKIFSLINRAGKGIEIGPGYNPIAPKSEGFNVVTVDHTDKEGLLAKYGAFGMDVSKIEEVDYVWNGGSLCELIGQKHAFDYIIASHVVEHIPNLISFISSLEYLLKPDGIVSLAIPDKRYCFDCYKPITLTPELLAASLENRQIHSAKTRLENVAYNCHVNGNITWSYFGSLYKNNKQLMYSIDNVKEHYENIMREENATYSDYHCWSFTPSSFRLCILELNLMGLIGLREAQYYNTYGCEFFVSLKPGEIATDNAERQRSTLLKEIGRENMNIGRSVDKSYALAINNLYRYVSGALNKFRAK